MVNVKQWIKLLLLFSFVFYVLPKNLVLFSDDFFDQGFREICQELLVL